MSRDPIGYLGGLNLFWYVGSRLTYYVDPTGLLPPGRFGLGPMGPFGPINPGPSQPTDCQRFIENILDFARNHTADELESELWNLQIDEPGGVSGFDPDLIAGGQGTEVYRHLQAAGGSGMNTGFLAFGQFLRDFGEIVFWDDPGNADENLAEMLGDGAGNAMGNALADAMNDDFLSCEEEADLRDMLEDLLCE